MNKKFLSAILFGALMVTSTGTFVSCKDYDDDIDQINTELAGLKDQIAALQSKVNDGKWITSINSISGGFAVTFNDGQSFNIVNGKDGADGANGTNGADGAAGAAGTVITIGEDGFWYFDGEKSEYKAVASENETKAPYVEEGYWYFYNEEGEAEKSEYKALGATYAVEANGVYTLYVPDANGELVSIKLPTAGSTLSDVELLGWAALPKLDKSLSEAGDISADLEVEYAYIAKIVKAYDGNKETTWSAQKEVKKGQVLTTLAPGNTNLIARIESGADAADLEFSLKNSKGQVLPITVGAPAAYQGLLSRSAGLHALALDNTDAVYAKEDDYTDLYKGGLYALVEKSGFTSNYELVVTKTAATVTQQKVVKVAGAASTGTETIGGTAYDLYEVDLNKNHALTFGTDPQYVYDYYVEAEDATIANMFGFSANKANGTFKVTGLADQITTTSFLVNVYSLHIDGKIYEETIAIKPKRTLGSEVVYNMGNQVIKSSMKLTVDLADMFTALGSDAAIWKNSTLGAKSATVSVKKGDATDNLLIVYNTHKNGSTSTTDVNTATSVELTFQAEVSGAAKLEAGKEYTITITYYDADGNALNSIKVKFTPVMPALSSYITKRDAVWANGVLMAYFDDPAAGATTTLPSTYDITKGFTKLGDATAQVNVILTLDSEQKINNTLVTGNTNPSVDMAAISGTTITLKQTTIGTATKFWAYAQELNVKVAATYLNGAYTFSEAEVKAAAFKIKVQSALEAGKIVPAEGTSIIIPAAAAGEVAKLTPEMITGYTYNNQPYSLFKNCDANNVIAYKYTYIQNVEFTSVDNVIYTVGNVVDASWDNNKEVPGYVEIKSGNISQTTVTKIKVKVTDMYGHVKEAEVPLTITVGE